MRAHTHSSYMTLIGVHKMHGRVHRNLCHVTGLLVVDLRSSLANLTTTHPLPIASKLKVRLLGNYQQTHTQVIKVFAYCAIVSRLATSSLICMVVLFPSPSYNLQLYVFDAAAQNLTDTSLELGVAESVLCGYTLIITQCHWAIYTKPIHIM